MRTTIISLLLSLCAVSVAAQDFTLESEFIKQQKKYPFIEKFETSQNNDVNELHDVQFIRQGSADALALDVFLPSSNAKNLTPIVFIHGGGWRSGNKSLDWPMARRLAAAGRAVFCVDYRLSTVAPYPASLIDVNDALCFIASHASDYGIDISRLTLVGSSSGGQMSALLGATNGTADLYISSSAKGKIPTIKKVIDIDGVLAFIHPESQEGRDRPGKPSAATLWFGCTAAEDSTLWNQASALNNVNQASADFVFINSSLRRFSAGQDEMVNALSAQNKCAIVFRTERTPHTFWLFHPWAPSVLGIIMGATEY